MLLEFIFLFLLGLIFGSFVSAVSYRIPRRISFAKGRSFCPNCKKQISWFDNIPLFSYIFLGGKCRNCKRRISLRYPLIELFSGIGFVSVFYLFSQVVFNIPYLIYLLLMYLLLLTIFVIDLEHQIIPDSLVFSGILIVFLYQLLMANSQLFGVVFSGFISSLFLLFIHLITKGRGMGLGDVKFAVFAGMFVGLKLAPIWLFLAFLTGGIGGSILILIGKAKMKTKIAFGPFLIIGIVLTYIFSNEIMHFLGLL